MTSGSLLIIVFASVLGYFDGKILLGKGVNLDTFDEHPWLSWVALGGFAFLCLGSVWAALEPPILPLEFSMGLAYLLWMSSKAVFCFITFVILTMYLQPTQYKSVPALLFCIAVCTLFFQNVEIQMNETMTSSQVNIYGRI